MVTAKQVPEDLDGRGDTWKELTNKIAWAIGTTLNEPYSGGRSRPKSLGGQLAALVLRVAEPGREWCIADLYQESLTRQRLRKQ